MILRPPKNFNEYSVSVPMSIDWMLKTLQKVVKGENVVTKINAGTNITISPVGGTGQVTINASVPATPTLAQVTTAGNTTTNAITVGGLTVDTDTLYVDATNNRVGIGTVSPSANLHVKSTGTVLNYVETTSSNGRVISQFKSPVAYFDMRAHGSGFTSETWFGVNSANALVLSSFGGQFVLGTYDSQSLTLGTNNTNRAVIFGASGNLAINTTTDAGYKLDVNGTTRFNGNSYINGNLGVGVGTPVQELHLLGTFRSQAKTGSDNVFFEGINSAGTMVAQMQEASSGGFGGLIFNGQRNNASGGNGIGFAGYIGTSTGNNAAIEFRAAGGTISSPTTHPTSVPIAKFCRLDTPTTLKDEFIIYGDGNIGINTTTNAGQKLQVSGKVFIKGTTSLTATKVFEVQNGAGESIMDFRDNQYAFFGCGQGGGSATGFIFNYSNTSYCQFSGYNYGAGAGAYKPILLDTDIVGRGNGVFVNFGVSTNPPPNSDTEFGVRGRTSDTTSFIARFRNSSNTDMFAIRADGALYTDSQQGYSGTLTIPGNPPGSTTITITNGLITNIA